MDSLPLETFQLICSYCSLYTLAHLRLVSKSFLNKVDGSLNARSRQLGIVQGKDPQCKTPRKTLAELTDPRKAGFITMTLSKGRIPMEITFNGYNPKYNYLEFILKSPPDIVSVPQTTTTLPPTAQNINLSTASNPMVQYAINELRRQVYLEPFSLGKLVLHSWEQDRLDREANPIVFNAGTVTSSSSSSANASSTRPRRSSIGQAHTQKQEEAKADQASSTAGYMSRITRAFWGATSISGNSSSDNAGATEVGSNSTLASSSSTYDALIQAAQSRFYANNPELSPQDRQYKFNLQPGEHFLGDNDFMMKYTVGKPIDGERLFEVDYIRVSWKWILSGIGPIPGTGRKLSDINDSSPSTTSLTSPSTMKRLGGIYTHRVQRVIEEIKRQGVSKIIRGELAMQGYSEQLLPRDYLSVNLHAEPIVAWIMRTDPDKLSGDRDDWAAEEEESTEGHMHHNVLHKAEQEKDQQALEQMVAQLSEHMGYLTCRCILEELLQAKGLSRSLVWTVGRVRRQLMDPVPPPAVAQDLVRILETTDQQRAQHRQLQQQKMR